MEDIGGGYGKDPWSVWYRGRKVEGVMASVVRQFMVVPAKTLESGLRVVR